MTLDDVQKIIDSLERIKTRKHDVQMAQAQAELKAIDREREAYLDGIYDFAKAVNQILKEESTWQKMKPGDRHLRTVVPSAMRRVMPEG